MRNFTKNSDRGSITIFGLLVIPLLLFVGWILYEYSYMLFQIEKTEAEVYLELDQKMSSFERPLFQELGLFAVRPAQEIGYGDPLSEPAVLSASIHSLMEKKLLLDGIRGAENVLSDFLKARTRTDLTLFDMSELNREVKKLIKDGVELKLDPAILHSFLIKLVTMSPYMSCQGASLATVKNFLEAERFEELQDMEFIFILRPSIRESYEQLMKGLKKYDVLNFIGSFELADYCISYLGYSGTKEEIDDLRSEYIISNIEVRALQRYYIKAELYLIRLLLNFADVLTDPALRDRVMRSSGYVPELFPMEALVLCAAESAFDVADLFDRHPVPLRKGNNFQTYKAGNMIYRDGFQYPEYLKIMMLLLSEETVLKRLDHCIEVNYSLDTEKLFTAVSEGLLLRVKGKVIPYEIKRVIQARLSFVSGINEP